MRIRVERKPFLAALRTALPIVTSRGRMPALDCFRLATLSKTGLEIQATDQQTTIRRRIGGLVVDRPGTVITPAKTLVKLIASLGEKEVILDSDASGLCVRSGAQSVTLATIEPETWPAWSTGTNADPSLIVSAEQFGEALVRAGLCVSEDPHREVLTAIALQLELGSSTMHVVATDSFRLGALEVKLHNGSPVTETLLLPASCAAQAAKHMRSGGGLVGLRIHRDGDAPLVTIDHHTATWTTRCIDGQFINWKELIPASPSARIARLDRAELVQALATVRAVCGQGKVVQIAFGQRCTLRARNDDGVSVHEELLKAELTPRNEGEEFVIAFNSKFLADALGFVQTEDVELRIQDQFRAANFAQTDSCYVLMPVRQF